MRQSTTRSANAEELFLKTVLLCSLPNNSKAKQVLLTFSVLNEHIHDLIHLNLEGLILGVLGLISSYASVCFSNKGLSNVVHSNITAAQRGLWWHDHDTAEQNTIFNLVLFQRLRIVLKILACIYYFLLCLFLQHLLTCFLQSQNRGPGVWEAGTGGALSSGRDGDRSSAVHCSILPEPSVWALTYWGSTSACSSALLQLQIHCLKIYYFMMRAELEFAHCLMNNWQSIYL